MWLLCLHGWECTASEQGCGAEGVQKIHQWSYFTLPKKTSKNVPPLHKALKILWPKNLSEKDVSVILCWGPRRVWRQHVERWWKKCILKMSKCCAGQTALVKWLINGNPRLGGTWKLVKCRISSKLADQLHLTRYLFSSNKREGRDI